MIARAVVVVAVLGAPALAAPLEVTPSYVPRAHPPGPGAAPADDGSNGYFYVSAAEQTAMAGAGAMLVQARPRVSTIDYHSLAEIAVESADGQQIVELGWNVDPGVNADDLAPHLFSFHWVDGVGTCYNGCGWVQVSATHMPGGAVEPSATPHAFQIEHRADARWWLTYDGDDLGYYPDTLWKGAYTEAGLTQWFGEIAAGPEAAPCTEMGTGAFGTAGSADTFAGIYTIGSGSAHVPAVLTPIAETLPVAYTAGNVTATSFGFGGPGVADPSCAYIMDAPDAAPARDAATMPQTGGGCCDAGGSGGGAVVLAAWIAAALRRRR